MSGTAPEDPEKLAKFKHVVKMMGNLLIARKDVKAIEYHGTWMPHRVDMRKTADGDLIPFRLIDFQEHMFGTQCLGTYLLDTDNNVKFFAIDVDLRKEGATYWPVRDAEELEELIQLKNGDEILVNGVLDTETVVGNLEEALHDPEHVGHRWARILVSTTLDNLARAVERELGLPSLPVVTGGGGHLLVPLGELTPAVEARVLARTVMESVGGVQTKGDNFWQIGESGNPGMEIEVFPKQDTIPKSGGFGNLIRLPMGLHHRTKQRTYFLGAGGAFPWSLPKADAVATLEAASAALGLETGQ